VVAGGYRLVTSVRYTEQTDMNEAIEGAVIDRAEVVDGWTRVFLKDGRVMVFADCECFALVMTKEILQ
jgi:hypothetical protein